MVKRHRFRRHPMHIYKGLMLGAEEEYGGIVQLDLQATALATDTGVDTTGWFHLDVGALAPKYARAAILDIAVRDNAAAAGDAYMEVGNPGIIQAAKTQIIYSGDVNAYNSRLVAAILNDDDKINLKITATGAVFDYVIKLIGWLLDPSVAKITPPSEDLKATFVVNQ